MTAYSEQLVNDLEDKAKLFRREILEMTFQAESGHPGGSLSAAWFVANPDTLHRATYR
jgi:transketolase